jgi:D-alanyl-lipoteichoic acid acyltransferase DltB (MBOAT superfamily)
MSFISWEYAIFLPAIVFIYWQMGHRLRIFLLLFASYFFYGLWDPRFLSLLMASTCIDYCCGRALVGVRIEVSKVVGMTLMPLVWILTCRLLNWDRGDLGDSTVWSAASFSLGFTLLYECLWMSKSKSPRRAFLWLSILTNLGALCFFKYFGFFADGFVSLARWIGFEPGWTAPHIILPVAISFYTFQSIAYAVDIYRNKAAPLHDLPTFAAYLSFFPQLIAGPIERPGSFLPQFTEPRKWSREHLSAGLPRILVGVFKKVFVADNCALLANYAFAPDTVLNLPWAVIGVLAFAFQIYGDFSGYTDIARGSARLLGIELSINFRLPYLARGPSDFWQRWHITLSTWFRDYVYIPLGGNRRGLGRTLLNLWISMLLAGLWHGANWTFVLWGGYHAMLLTTYRLFPFLQRLESDDSASPFRRASAVALMFVLTLTGWVFFRAADLQGIGAWFSALTRLEHTQAWLGAAGWLALHVVPLLLLQATTRKMRDEADLSALHWSSRGLVYFFLFLLSAFSAHSEVEFIYFQF